MNSWKVNYKNKKIKVDSYNHSYRNQWMIRAWLKDMNSKSKSSKFRLKRMNKAS